MLPRSCDLPRGRRDNRRRFLLADAAKELLLATVLRLSSDVSVEPSVNDGVEPDEASEWRS